MNPKVQKMQNPQGDNISLTLLSGLCAIISISSIQPYLTFAASMIAILSGIISIYKKTKK